MNVLVVDSSKMVREIIRDEIRDKGFSVLEASDPDEAYEVISNQDIALITLAVELPGESGYEVCSKIRNGDKGNRIPVVFITGNDTLEGRKRGYESGATEFIVKPFRRGFVGHTVSKLLNPEKSPLQGLKALVVDDSLTARQIVSNFLKSKGVTVLEAKDGLQGYQAVTENKSSLDLIITDWMMPGLMGNELCKKIRKELELNDIPIIVLSGAKEDSFSIIDVFRSGATDYLHKPFIQEELLARLTVHLKARMLTRKLTIKLQQLRQMNEQLEKMACTDPLTELPNRKFFFDRLIEANERKQRYGSPLTFTIVDIDLFKKINDTYGHQTGDAIIKELAEVLSGVIRKSDIVGRLGGEEFAILTTDITIEDSKNFTEKIRSAIESHDFMNESESTLKKVTVSIGAYFSIQGDPSTVEEIYNKADEQLYLAKEAGRNCFRLETYTP